MKSSNSSVQKLIELNNNESIPVEKLLTKNNIIKNPISYSPDKSPPPLNTDTAVIQSMKTKQEQYNNTNICSQSFHVNYFLNNNDFVYDRKIHKSDNLHVVSNNNLNTNKNRSESHNKKKIVFTKSGYFEFKTNIRQNNFSLVHNELIPKTSNEKSLWLSSPIEKNFWFKGKIKALQNNKSKEILYQYYNDDENLLLLSAVKKGNICSFYVTNDYKIKIGRMKCCNFIGTNYKINQYINKFYAEINYKLNIFGLNGPMKLKILVRNENTNEYDSKEPVFNSCK